MDRRSLLGVDRAGLDEPAPASAPATSQPGGVAVTADDELTINVYPFITASVLVRYRITSVNNTVLLGSGNLPFTNGTPAQLQLPLQAGYLTSVYALAIYPPNVLRGDAFAVCSLNSMALFSDYLQSNIYQGWPGGRQLSSVEGPGAVNFLRPHDPAIGQEWAFTVPGNTRWLLHSLRMQLKTSAAKKQRLVSFVVDQGSHGQFSATVLQPASTVVIYELARGADSTFLPPNWGGSNVGRALIPAGLPLPLLGATGGRGMSIGTLTAGLDPGDQWTSIGGLYEQWYQAST